MRAMKTAEIAKLRMDMISQLTPWRGGDSGGEDPGIVFCSRIDRRSSARFNDESPVRFIGGGASLVHHHCLAPCYSFPHDHSKDTKVPKPIVETGGVGSICCAYHLRYFRKSDIGELRKREVQHSSTPTGLGPPARWSCPDAYDGYFMYVPRARYSRR
jgi:hypothetical protein